MEGKKKITAKELIDYILMGISFVLIITLAIIFKQHPIKVWPLINSLFIMLLSMRAYRIAHILGALNCLIYAIGYYMLELYGTMFSTLFVSFPLPIISFFMWNKRKYKHSTKFRRLPVVWEIAIFVGIAIACVITGFILSSAGSSQASLDAICMVLGIVLPIMGVFALIECVGYDIINMTVSFTMFLLVAIENPSEMPYIVSNVFNFYCVIGRVYTWIKLYRIQQKEKQNAEVSPQNDNLMSLEA